jgi:hypothetical protein
MNARADDHDDQQQMSEADRPTPSDEDPQTELEAHILMTDEPSSFDTGTTALEHVHGASLDERLEMEQPEGTDPSTVARAAIADRDETDREGEMVADEAAPAADPWDGPEESALTVRDEAPGGSASPSDDYVIDDE